MEGARRGFGGRVARHSVRIPNSSHTIHLRIAPLTSYTLISLFCEPATAKRLLKRDDGDDDDDESHLDARHEDDDTIGRPEPNGFTMP